MAVPLITSVNPTTGHTGGKGLVEIEGTGFRLPTMQAIVDGIVPEAPPSVRVKFGTRYATVVRVVSTTLLYALTPIHDPTDLPVDIIVENLDDAGVPIVGESATQAESWRFVRPNVTDGDSDLVRLIEAFRNELWRQVTANVTWPQNTDYDADTGDTLSITEVPEFPGLIIAASALEENDFHAKRDPQESPHPTDPDGFVVREPPSTVDVVFTVVGISDSTKELMNLAATLKRFFRKNPYLSMARDPDDASKGDVSYEMTAHDSPDVKLSIESNNDNLHTFAVTARVVGFDIEAMFEIRDAAGAVVRGPGGADEATIDIGKTLAEDPDLSIEPR